MVYGSRTFGSHSAYSFWYVMGNKGVTTAANMIFNSYISDLETCFKLMPLELFRSLEIRSAGFGMEAEITGKLLRRRIRPYEVPISYRARTREEGKKITWKDGVEALWILIRERASETHLGESRRPPARRDRRSGCPRPARRRTAAPGSAPSPGSSARPGAGCDGRPRPPPRAAAGSATCRPASPPPRR